MTYTPIQLEVIKLFGDKTLSDGCLYTKEFSNDHMIYDDGYPFTEVLCKVGQGGFEPKVFDNNLIMYYDDGKWKNCSIDLDMGYMFPGLLQDGKNQKILGHIPHLEDLFRLAEERGFTDIYLSSYKYNDGGSGYIRKRLQIKDNIFVYDPTLPLLDQPSLPEIVKLFS